MPDPKKQKKRVWKVDFHESDPSRRKISLHNAKKYAIAGLREKKSRVRKETKEFAEKQELEFSDAPSMDESTEPEDLQQTTDNAGSTGDEWELEEKEQEEDSEQGDIHV